MEIESIDSIENLLNYFTCVRNRWRTQVIYLSARSIITCRTVICAAFETCVGHTNLLMDAKPFHLNHNSIGCSCIRQQQGDSVQCTARPSWGYTTHRTSNHLLKHSKQAIRRSYDAEESWSKRSQVPARRRLHVNAPSRRGSWLARLLSSSHCKASSLYCCTPVSGWCTTYTYNATNTTSRVNQPATTDALAR